MGHVQGRDDRPRAEAARREQQLQHRRPTSGSTTSSRRPKGCAADHFLLGQSLLFDRLTWYEHTQVGYARMRKADAAGRSAADRRLSARSPWEANVEGVRAATRHEIDLPLELGPTKIVPYVLGEAAYWGEDLNGDEVTRLYGQAGVKASLPMWRADPTVSSELFNLNGLAHKVVFEAEAFYAEADQDLDRLAALRPARRRLDRGVPPPAMAVTHVRPAGGHVRAAAVRRAVLRPAEQPARRSVTSPSTEIADDLMRSPPGHQAAVADQARPAGPASGSSTGSCSTSMRSLFPDPDRDNFGEALGLVDYDFRWHVGDRVTLLSDGFFDVFSRRPAASDVRRPHQPAGVRQRLPRLSLDRRADQQHVLTGSLSYRMSEKWIATAGATLRPGPDRQHRPDRRPHADRRIVPDQLGMNFDASRDNLGISFLHRAAVPPQQPPGPRRRRADSAGRGAGAGVTPYGKCLACQCPDQWSDWLINRGLC